MSYISEFRTWATNNLALLEKQVTDTVIPKIQKVAAKIWPIIASVAAKGKGYATAYPVITGAVLAALVGCVAAYKIGYCAGLRDGKTPRAPAE